MPEQLLTSAEMTCVAIADKFRRRSWFKRLVAPRKPLLVPEERNFVSLWQLHGLENPRYARGSRYSDDDRIECLCLWLDALYGAGTTEALDVCGRIAGRYRKHGQIVTEFRDETGGHISLKDPIDAVIGEFARELPVYESNHEKSMAANNGK